MTIPFYIWIIGFVVLIINLELRFRFTRRIWSYLYDNRKWKKIISEYNRYLNLPTFRENCDRLAKAHPQSSEMEIIAKAKEEINKNE